MDIKIVIGFGRKGQHTLRLRNQNLETQVAALTTALEASNEENKELREQLKDALSDRIAKGHRAMGQGLGALRLVQGPVIRPVEGVKNRYRIVRPEGTGNRITGSGDEGA